MLHPANLYAKLAFDEIKNLIAKECISPMGKAMLDKLQFITHFDLLHKLLKQTHEFKTILSSGSSFPSDHYHDLGDFLNKLRIEGSFLEEEDFFKTIQVLQTTDQCIRFFKQLEGVYPQLQILAEPIRPGTSVIALVSGVIDEKGKIKENASPRLLSIVQEIASAERDAQKKINQLYRHAVAEGWVGDAQLTIREGRLVIPVLSEHKRKIKGFIHGESATGQTCFIEPAEVFELNNKVRDLSFEKRKEIIKILTELTTAIAPYYDDILAAYRFLGLIDFIRAKALFAKKIDAEMPILRKEPLIRFFDARHPLLFLNFKEQNKKVESLNIQIDQDDRIVVLSGPNAGGKSVCLKTVGLLQLMLQHGLLIPANEYSEAGIFKNIFADIGDDQSLESDLSTYSAHLSSMKKILEFADKASLILIDEFGTGTDPVFGGPIAEAVLEVLNRKKAKGLVTTHYSNLKIFANKEQGLINASMLFDAVNLQPLYRFEAGKPGSSYALEIAEKTGLQPEVLELARKKIGDGQKRVDLLLVELEKDKKQVHDLKLELEKKERKMNFLLDEADKTKIFLDENKKKLIKETKLELDALVKEANRQIEHTIREITESKADKIRTRASRDKLQAEIKQVQKKINKETQEQQPEINQELHAGDYVRIMGSETSGRIHLIRKNKAELEIGDIRTQVDISRLEKIQAPQSPTRKEKRQHAFLSELVNEKTTFNTILDLRGKRGDEALIEVERFLDKASLMGYKELKILHGKGDGILRKLIREYLQKYGNVEHFSDEELEFGGSGITVVNLS